MSDLLKIDMKEVWVTLVIIDGLWGHFALSLVTDASGVQVGYFGKCMTKFISVMEVYFKFRFLGNRG